MGPRFLNANLTIKDWVEETTDLGLLHRFCHQLSCLTHQWAQIWPGLPFAADMPVKPFLLLFTSLTRFSLRWALASLSPFLYVLTVTLYSFWVKPIKKKKKEHCYDRSFWCSYTLSTLQSCYSSLKKNPVKLKETSALLIMLQEWVLAIQYSSIKNKRQFEGHWVFHRLSGINKHKAPTFYQLNQYVI